jgi:hypothetical protein
VAALSWAWLALATGCLAEPERPHGLGPPIAAGSVIRHHVAVGDLNGDGYDDLVTYGNEGAPGTNPTAFVYFGGEILQNPDLRASLALVSADPGAPPTVWYEALDGSIYASADGADHGIVIASGQDAVLPGQPNAPARAVFFHYLPIVGRAFGEAQRSSGELDFGDGGYAPDESGFDMFERDTRSSLPAREIMYGRNVIKTMAAPIDIASRDEASGWSLDAGEVISSLMVLPPQNQSEDLLVVTDRAALRTTNDGIPEFTTGPHVGLSDGTGSARIARGRAQGDHFYAVANSNLDPDLILLDVAGAADPVVYRLVGVGPTEDVAIADVGGDSALDVVVLDSSTLGVYRDVALADGHAVAAAMFGSRDALPGYDAIAVGNFHGDDRLEIYVINTADAAQPIYCYRLASPDTLERCASE